MPIKVSCPKCQREAYFADNDAGLVIACLACGQHIVVPTPARPGSRTPAQAVAPTTATAATPAPAHPGPAAPAIARHAPTHAATHSAGGASATPAGPTVAAAAVSAATPQARSKGAGRPAATAAAVAPMGAAATSARRPRTLVRRASMVGAVAGIAGAMLLLGSIVVVAMHYLNTDRTAADSSTTRPASTAPGATRPVAAPATRPVVASKTPAVPPVPVPPLPAGFIALERIELHGKFLIDSYNSAKGPYDRSKSSNAILATNGPLYTSSEGAIKGTIRGGPTADIKTGKKVSFTGEIERLHAPLVARAMGAEVDAAAGKNDNASLPKPYFDGVNLVVPASKTVKIPGGTYYLRDFLILGKGELQFQGPVILVITGRVLLGGDLEAHDDRPANCRIRMPRGGQMVIGQNASAQFDFDGPQATVEVSGKGDIFGAIVCRVLRLSGVRSLHFDESIGNP